MSPIDRRKKLLAYDSIDVDIASALAFAGLEEPPRRKRRNLKSEAKNKPEEDKTPTLGNSSNQDAAASSKIAQHPTASGMENTKATQDTTAGGKEDKKTTRDDSGIGTATEGLKMDDDDKRNKDKKET
jgi:hypothetical protein